MLFAVFAGLMSSLSLFYYAVAASVCEEQGNFLAFLTRMHHIDH